MDFSAAWIAIPIQIFVVDLLLGADNALLIAVASNGLNRDDARRAAMIGSGGAIVLRLLLATIATSLPVSMIFCSNDSITTCVRLLSRVPIIGKARIPSQSFTTGVESSSISSC